MTPEQAADVVLAFFLQAAAAGDRQGLTQPVPASPEVASYGSAAFEIGMACALLDPAWSRRYLEIQGVPEHAYDAVRETLDLFPLTEDTPSRAPSAGLRTGLPRRGGGARGRRAS